MMTRKDTLEWVLSERNKCTEYPITLRGYDFVYECVKSCADISSCIAAINQELFDVVGTTNCLDLVGAEVDPILEEYADPLWKWVAYLEDNESIMVWEEPADSHDETPMARNTYRVRFVNQHGGYDAKLLETKCEVDVYIYMATLGYIVTSIEDVD